MSPKTTHVCDDRTAGSDQGCSPPCADGEPGTTSSTATGDEMNEITDRLEALITRGFQFTHPHDSSGALVAIVGIRVHNGVIDIVQLYSEDDADAARVPGDEPDVLFPRTVLWRGSGSALTTLDGMLALEDPAPDTEEVACQPSGSWMPTRPGRATWLAASA
jgi:hypothetical protein